jgi:hypothetical protein
VIAAALVAACASNAGPAWERPGGTAEQRGRDEGDCMTRALTIGDTSPSGPGNRARIDREFERCMQQRGWNRSEN